MFINKTLNCLLHTAIFKDNDNNNNQALSH